MSKAELRYNEDGSQTEVFQWRPREAQSAP